MNMMIPVLVEPPPESIADATVIIMPRSIMVKPTTSSKRNFCPETDSSSASLVDSSTVNIRVPAYYEVKCSITVATMRITVSIIERIRTVLSDFLSVPKMMGTGPIITAPPPLTCTLFFLFENKSIRIATVAMSVPAKSRVMPMP
jgi:hypothetical protein